MISGLTGIVNYKTDQTIELLVGNISFSVLTPLPLITGFELGDKATLYTNLVVGEKLLELYGFETREDVTTFKMLTSVAGVGPKTALQIFNQKSGQEIRKAIDEADVDFFLDMKGIGKKTAQRLIVDLRSILDKVKLKEQKKKRQEQETVYAALLQLGFTKQEIDLTIPKLPKKQSDEKKINFALKLLSSDVKSR